MISLTVLTGIAVTYHSCKQPNGKETTYQQMSQDDSNISTEIKRELSVVPNVSAENVNVETLQGIVTLTGTAKNILAKEKAKEVAMRIKGVKSVINDIKVKTPFIPNNILEEHVTDAIIKDPAIESAEMEVEADSGKITITGTVDSWQETQIAGNTVKSVSGVTEVENNLNFHYEQRNYQDQEMEDEIKAMMYDDVLVDGADINVDVQDGIAVLSGTVASAAEKEEAIKNSWVNGINDVKAEDLKVTDWNRSVKYREGKYVQKPDEELEEAIKRQFLYDYRVNPFDLKVNVKNGKAYISGNVTNLRAKRLAKQDAQNVVGVVSVKNNIQVQPKEDFSTKTIKDNVKNALEFDPYLENYDLKVEAKNDKVMIYGNVDKYFEKAHAEKAAEKVAGVSEVENNIKIGKKDSDNVLVDYWKPYPLSFTRFPDEENLKEEVEKQLWWSPYVDEDEINIEIKGDKVILTGQVETYKEKQEATRSAFEAGAPEVENKVKVGYALNEGSS